MASPMTFNALKGAPFLRPLRQNAFGRFLIDGIVFGVGLGIAIPTILLVTDTFGLLTLTRAQSDAVAAAIALIVSGVMIFVPLSFAAAASLGAAQFSRNSTDFA
jgi:hypothetical protein